VCQGVLRVCLCLMKAAIDAGKGGLKQKPVQIPQTEDGDESFSALQACE